MRTAHPALLAVFAALLVTVADASAAEPSRAGVLVNARIHTLTDGQPVAEALAWNATGRIVAVGTRQEVMAKADGAVVHDARGATVVPGLIDAHAHLMGLGYALMRVDLVGARSKAEVIARLQAFAAQLPEDAWLLGRGWDQNDWPGKTFPTATDLDAVFPNRPVWLERVDGHAGWANCDGAASRRARPVGRLAAGRRADRARARGGPPACSSTRPRVWWTTSCRRPTRRSAPRRCDARSRRRPASASRACTTWVRPRRTSTSTGALPTTGGSRCGSSPTPTAMRRRSTTCAARARTDIRRVAWAWRE